ncbi:uncharacterized protein C8Q71DRAFT_860526 [Rhodofomes roseus]|uniref:Uncharacterized protein n=1 Tax=Rhodofomes roseus TaxID=34475 RepID=A0A4Y9YPM5_9APHY|nr:uncharacterized protein C8Q71DRAFT_860526 [Rhodofomes roseus]KAH9833257.1 hypothetical protein C8Q71DRAFT_860526 [Rhodofomes roseus]TFY64516.1 hypothetical protein EVJ58_g2579 [Rhodofomes roseus]
MSSQVGSGAQSPPLEATGQEKPMGVTGASGAKPDAVPDIEQRQQYFQGAETDKQSADQVGSGQPDKVKTD